MHLDEDSFEIQAYDNDAGWFIVNNAEALIDDTTSAFARISWLEHDQGIHLCMSLDGDELADLSAEPLPDSADLTRGCYGEPWLEIREPLPFAGTWAAGEALLDIQSFAFSFEHALGTTSIEIVHKDPDEPWLVTISSFDPTDIQYTFLTWQVRDTLPWICGTPADYTATETEASDFDLVLDPEDLETGCNGEQWQQLLIPLPIRGNWSAGDGIPTTLWETTAATSPATATAMIVWDVLSYNLAAQIMVLEVASTAEGFDPPPGDRFLKLQWYTVDDSLHYICILGTAATAPGLTGFPLESFDPAGVCGSGFLTTPPIWHRLNPTD